jgi:hypothetical protein
MPLPRLLILLLFFLLLLPGAIAGQAQAKDINTLYKEGMNAYKVKDYTTYLERFKSLDRLRPNHPVVLYNLAGAYALNKQTQPSLKCLEQLIPIDANPKIAEDPDFQHIRNEAGFKAILEKIKQLHTPISNSSVAFTFPQRHLHPESIAYDSRHKTFYLSSVHQRKIVYVDKEGKLRDFTASGQDGLYAVLGIRIDSTERVLWAASNALPQMTGYKKEDNKKENKSRTAIFKYHLDTRKLIEKYPLQDGPGHGFDDIAIHPGGDLYISDTRGIYRIAKKTGKLVPFLNSPRFRSLQGIDFCAGGKKIIAADWSTGLYLIDIPSGKIESPILPIAGFSLKGIDGLYYLPAGNSLIAIQNGIKPMRVMRFFLDPTFKRVSHARTIERANPAFNEPTLGVVVHLNRQKTFFYVANSQWNGYTKAFKPLPFEKLPDIIILKTLID